MRNYVYIVFTVILRYVAEDKAGSSVLLSLHDLGNKSLLRISSNTSSADFIFNFLACLHST